MSGKLRLPLAVHGDELERSSDRLRDIIGAERAQVLDACIPLQEACDVDAVLLRNFRNVTHGFIELSQALHRNCFGRIWIDRDAGNETFSESWGSRRVPGIRGKGNFIHVRIRFQPKKAERIAFQRPKDVVS